MTAKRPTIGLTLDSEAAGGWSKYPWYAVRANYADAIAEAGGLPVALPHHAGLAEAYLDTLDALVVTGAHSMSTPRCTEAVRCTRPPA